MSSTKSATSSRNVVGRSSASSERGFARLQTLLRHIGLPQRAQTSLLYNNTNNNNNVQQNRSHDSKKDEYIGTLESLAETQLFDSQEKNNSQNEHNSIFFNHMLCIEGVNNQQSKRKGIHSTGAMQLVTFDNPQLQFSLLCRCSKSDLIRSLKSYSTQTQSSNHGYNNSGMIFHFSGIVTRQLEEENEKDKSQSKSVISSSPSLFRFMSSNLLNIFSPVKKTNSDKSRALPLNPLLFDTAYNFSSEEYNDSNEPVLWVNDSKPSSHISSSNSEIESKESAHHSDVISVRDVHSLLSSDKHQFPVLYMFTLNEDLADTKQLPPTANIARDILSVCTEGFKSLNHFVLLEIVPTDINSTEQNHDLYSIPTLSECVRDPVDSYFRWKYGHEFDIGGHYYLPNSPRSQIHNVMRSYIQRIIQIEADSDTIKLLDQIGHRTVREMFYWHLLCSFMNTHKSTDLSLSYNSNNNNNNITQAKNNIDLHEDVPSVSLPNNWSSNSSSDTFPCRQLVSYPDLSPCYQSSLWNEMQRRIHKIYNQLKEERRMAFRSIADVSASL